METEKNNTAKSQVTIVTHNAKFHTDDVFGVASLCLMLEQQNPNTEICIIRTRDRDKIDAADYVVDTGDQYDEVNNRFDHHQVGGAGVRKNSIPYASFGLVWKKFGSVICGSQIIADDVEQMLVLPIDARDNGIEITVAAHPPVKSYEIRDVIESFRPTWKEGPDRLDQNFLVVVQFAKEILKREIRRFTDFSAVKDIILDIYTAAEDKRLLILDRFYPYNGFLKDMPELLFVVYPSLSDNNWCVGTAHNTQTLSYLSRKFLPESWAGKNNQDLEMVTGVKGSIFCHRNKFMAVAKTKEAAIELAHIALKEAGK